MNDLLSEALHGAAGRFPGTTRRPTQIRREAERHRRSRRAAGGLLLAVVLALAVTSALGGRPRGSADPVPADGPTATSGEPLSLARRPLLTYGDWQLLTGGGAEGVTRSSSPPAQIHACTPDPRRGGGLVEGFAATYRQPARPLVRLQEYVLRYPDPATAIAAFAEVYSTFATCRDPQYADTNTSSFTPPRGLHELPDEQFVLEQLRKDATGPEFGPEPFSYQLIAARAGSIVLVVESTGWAERPMHTVEIALARALSRDTQR